MEFSRRDQVDDEKEKQVFTLVNKTCKFGSTRKSQVSFHLVKPVLAAIRYQSKLSVFSSRSSTLGGHFWINNECKVVFPHFFVVRPKTFQILKRSGKTKAITVYQYYQMFNMRKESTGNFIPGTFSEFLSLMISKSVTLFPILSFWKLSFSLVSSKNSI